MTEDAAHGSRQDATELASGSSVVAGAQVLDRLARGVSLFVLAGALGPHAYGVFGVAQSYVLTASMVAVLGTASGAVYFGARFRTDGDDAALKGLIHDGVRMSVGMGVAVMLALLPIAAAFDLDGDRETALALVAASPAILAQPLFRLFTGLVQSAKAMRDSSRITFVTLPAVTLAGTLAAIAIGIAAGALTSYDGPHALALAAHATRAQRIATIGSLLAMSAGFGAAAADGWRAVRRHFAAQLASPGPPRSVWRRLVAYSAPQGLADALYRLNLQLDVVCMSIPAFFITQASIGQYRAAAAATTLGVVPVTTLRTMLRPMLVELHRAGEHERLQALLQTTTRWIVMTTIPIYTVVAMFPGELLSILGEGYRGGAAPLLVLMIGQTMNILCAPAATMLQMGGYTRAELFNGAGAVLANLILNLLLIPQLGILGAAIANAVALTVWAAARAIEVRAWEGLTAFTARHLVSLAPPAIAVGTATALTPGTSVSSRVLVAAAVLVGSAAWVALTGISQEDRAVARLLRDKLVGRLRRR